MLKRQTFGLLFSCSIILHNAMRVLLLDRCWCGSTRWAFSLFIAASRGGFTAEHGKFSLQGSRCHKADVFALF
ncbi:hypothetical protein EDB80DRAFT_737936 [Ilyonectria destructans]|nr:hypothetical protein EDB80DRAFT_744371 [Ilyonectria destructans]KAH6980569.1 hypothetical protein EDB80DRAFT_737936 [Ilyonectria destructans]